MPSPAHLIKQNTALQQQLQEAQAHLLTLHQRFAATLIEHDATLVARDTLLAERDTTLAQRDVLIRVLREQLALLKHQRFDASSEQTPPEQARLFDEAEVHARREVTVTVPAHRRRLGRPCLPAGLPCIEVHHDLPEDQKICPHDGTALIQIGADTSEQLQFIPAQVQVLKHIRHKYACPQCESHVVTAPKPAQLIPKSIATPSLLAQVATSKYADGLPLYRLAAIFRRLDIGIDRTTMANWMVRVGLQVQGLIDLLWQQLLTAPIVHMDETTLQVLKEPGRAAKTKSYMWVTVAGPPDQGAVLFHYAPSRSAAIPETLLASFTGALMTDGYAGYDGLKTITHLGCMAHARRKFVEAQRVQPKGIAGKADEALEWFKDLYRIEREAAELNVADRYVLRQAKALPVLNALAAWLTATKPTTAPKTALGEAITYLQRQWPCLIRYLDDGRYPIDNNRVENAIRPFVLGRKGWLFSASVNGAKASANLYSLVETAKAHRLNPFEYLMHVFTHLPAATTPEALQALLPAQFVAAQRSIN